ncbi:hypothetical protein D3C75_806400 [compost metagenome]
MASNDRQGRGIVPVGNGNAGIGGYRNGRGNTRHNFEGDSFRRQKLGFLPHPSEDAGVSPFKAGYRFAAQSQIRQ